MKIKIAVLEKDRNYLSRFVSTMGSKYSDKLEFYAFTDSEVAFSTLNSSKIDVLIASDAFELDFSLIPKKCAFAYFVESADIEMFNNQRTICKYQKSDLLYKQILSVYSENAGNIIGLKVDDSTCKVVAFSSPCGGTGTTSMAVACAMNFANSGRKVLYLNLEDYGSTDVYFSGEGQFNMSDVVFALKSKKSNLSMKLESCVKQDASGVYFFSQPKIALDIMELTTEDIIRLIGELKLTGSYEGIVVDFGYGIDKNHLEILDIMSSIVLVGDGSENSNAKIFRAMNSLSVKEQSGESSIMGRMAIIYNKFSSKIGKTIDNLEIKTIGGAPRYDHATEKQVVQQLSQLKILDRIIG